MQQCPYPVYACKELLEVWLDDCKAGALSQHFQQVIITKEVEPAQHMQSQHGTAHHSLVIEHAHLQIGGSQLLTMVCHHMQDAHCQTSQISARL